MKKSTANQRRAGSFVLKTLRVSTTGRSPTELIEALREKGFTDETEAGHAIWHLLDSGEIRLRPDRKFEVRS